MPKHPLSSADCGRIKPPAEYVVLPRQQGSANHKIRFAEPLCPHRHIEGRKDQQELARSCISLFVGSNERRHSGEPRCV
jgi:hypothetical protein